VFEAAERARVESVGAMRMPGMATNLTAKLEDQYAHGRYADVVDRQEAPIDEALALLVRERLTGLKTPETARGLVDVWRDFIEE
jgi:cobaltochelatase CobT